MGIRELHRLSAPFLCRSASLHGVAHVAVVYAAAGAAWGNRDGVLYSCPADSQGLPTLGDISRSDHRLRHGRTPCLDDPASDPHHPGRPLLLPIANTLVRACSPSRPRSNSCRSRTSGFPPLPQV